MRMQVPDPVLLQTQPDINGLIKAKEIRLPAPISPQLPARRSALLPSRSDSIDFPHQGILFRQIMDPPDELFVPILFRFVHRAPDRVNVNLSALALQLRHLAITESLAKRGKSLEKIGDFGHGEDSTARKPRVATPPGASAISSTDSAFLER